ncbi:MAG: lysophospholipid acyltransferase family protein [Acidobacteria bacterium]|nr:lysophospholipid acyltransferase family protein [Acidobacteriota bacterium]
MRTWVEYACARGILAMLAWLPLGAAMAVGRGVAGLLDIAIPRLRRTARVNLSFALPGLGDEERERVIDGVFTSIARVFVALSRFPSLTRANIGEWIRYEGLEHFERGLAKGRGVLFYTAHLGNWELSAFAHALMSRPMHVVVRPLDNARIDGLVARYRSLSGNRVIEKKDFARGILKALAANEAVGILADQNVGLNEGVFVEFFGKQACAHPGFARIAAHAGTTVIPGYALWDEAEGRYVLRFYEPVEMSGDAQEDTQRLHRQLEGVIREYPDQWLWVHRRWKTRPPGEGPIY